MDIKKLKAICADIANQLSLKIELESVEPVSGGDINQAFLLKCNFEGEENRSIFVKINRFDKLDMFVQEKLSLQEIASTQTIAVPNTIALGSVGNEAYFAQEYIPMTSSSDVRLFASRLANLHQHSANAFGFNQNNYIGTTVQKNDWSHSWPEFFAQSRLQHQLDLLSKRGVSKRLLQKGRLLVADIDKFFVGHNPTPSLVHGDLWTGNYSYKPDGTPIIYDPACYYGDHEVDLAMLELFGNPEKLFFETYAQIFPINKGYSVRKNLYNLYHILNHANLFAGGYISQSETMIDTLMAS